MKNKKYTFCKIFDLEDKQILIRKDYCEEDLYKIKVSTFNGEILKSFSFGYIKEEEADECFDSITEKEVLRYLGIMDKNVAFFGYIASNGQKCCSFLDRYLDNTKNYLTFALSV